MGAPLQIGDTLLLTGPLRLIQAPLSPGQVDNRVNLARLGIFYRFDSNLAPRVLKEAHPSWISQLSFASRDWTYHQLHVGLESDPQTADILCGMLIGYRQSIPLDVEDDFRRTGTLHVFAVSGQNVSEIAEIGFVLIALLGLIPWRWSWPFAPVIILFCLLTGSQASAIRATLMALMLLIAWMLGRPIRAKGLWSIAFLSMTIWDPQTLLDPGSQLSFAVVLALIFLSPPIARMFEPKFQLDPFIPKRLATQAQLWERYFWKIFIRAVAASIAATLVSEPIAALQFHQFTPISVLANLIVVPTAGFITFCGTLAIVFSCVPLSGTIVSWINNFNWLLAQILLWFVHTCAHLPGASINVADLRTWSDSRPTFTLFPLQTHAAMLIRLENGKTWLVNTGREPDARFVTSRLCQYYGINQLTGLCLAQINTEANSGEQLIQTTFHPQMLALPILRTRSKVQKSLHPAAPQLWKAGDSISLSPLITAKILWPPDDSNDNATFTHATDRALVIQFISGQHSLLWLGEPSHPLRDQLLALYPNLTADAVVLGTAQEPTLDESQFVSAIHAKLWVHFHQELYALHTIDAKKPQPGGPMIWSLDQDGYLVLKLTP